MWPVHDVPRLCVRKLHRTLAVCVWCQLGRTAVWQRSDMWPIKLNVLKTEMKESLDIQTHTVDPINQEKKNHIKTSEKTKTNRWQLPRFITIHYPVYCGTGMKNVLISIFISTFMACKNISFFVTYFNFYFLWAHSKCALLFELITIETWITERVLRNFNFKSNLLHYKITAIKR